jgi:hypothetical protein
MLASYIDKFGQFKIQEKDLSQQLAWLLLQIESINQLIANFQSQTQKEISYLLLLIHKEGHKIHQRIKHEDEEGNCNRGI